MKKLLLSLSFISSFIFCGPVKAENHSRLEGFEGLPWGASGQAVVSYMQQVGVNESCGQYCFRGGHFAGLPVQEWQFKFRDNSFYRVVLKFQSRDTRTQVEQLNNRLVYFYGAPSCHQCDIYFEPYIYSNSWDFPVSPFSRHRVTLARSTYYHGKPTFWLTFTNGVVERINNPQWTFQTKRYFDNYNYKF